MTRSRPLPADRSRRKRAEKAGRRAEMLCALWLRLKGYRVLATRYQSPVGEIDIIAKRGNIMVAIEVKNRTDREAALHAVSAKQQNRIARALEAYAGKIDHADDLRFDLMIVAGRLKITHLKDAWRPN
jgi:putative endonuclease